MVVKNPDLDSNTSLVQMVLMNRYISILFFAMLFSCQSQNGSALVDLSDIQITARLQAVEVNDTDDYVFCNEEVKQYLEMEEYDCSFLIDETQYSLRSKSVYNEIGEVQSYCMYKSEGPIQIEREELVKDLKLMDLSGANDIPIKLENSIVIGEDTLTIEKANQQLKLLFIASENNSALRTIFTYETVTDN